MLTTSGDHTAIHWDVKTGRKLHTLTDHTEECSSGGFSPDGKTMLTGACDGTAILWNTETGEKIQTYKGHLNGIESVAFSPDGDTILSGSCDATSKLWDVKTGRNLRTYERHSNRIVSAAFSPDGKTMLTGSLDKTVFLWDVRTGRKLQTLEGHSDTIWAAALSPDGRTVLTGSGDRAAILWNAKTGRKLHTFEGHSGNVKCVAFSPDGRTVLTGSTDMTGILWDVKAGKKLRTLDGHSNYVNSVAFSPDGRAALTGCGDRTAMLWNVTTGKKLQTFEEHSGPISSVAFSPDGRTVLTGSEDETAILWDVRTGEKVRTLEGHSDWINSVAFSPDGRTVLTGSRDKTTILWDAETGRKLRTLEEPSNEIWSAGFGPDGRTVVTCPLDHCVKVWSVATGKLLLSMVAVENSREWLITTPEGLFDGSRGAINRICYRIGDGLNVLPVDKFFDGFYAPGLMEAILSGAHPLPGVDIEPPPAIRIVSPESGGRTENEKVTVEAIIDDRGGGVQTPVVKLNGSQYKVDSAPLREGDKRLRWKFTIPLVSGIDNTIEVHSATASGAIAGEPGRVTVRCEKPKERPELYMVAVGISDYADGGPRDLDCAKNDAETLAKVFRERGELFYGTGKVHVTTVVDEQATKKGIEKAIASVVTSAKPRDVFVLTLAGHGVTLGQRYYFIPYDYDGRGDEWRDEKVRRQGLPEDELDHWIAAVPATKRLLVYDTCQSGGALSRSTTYEKTLESLARRSGCHVIAAASSHEEAEELPDVGHGALTYALIAGLGAADKGVMKGRSAAARDGLIHAVDWFRFAAEAVPALTKLHMGKQQYVEFKSQAADFAVLPAKTKENDK